jgi:hypothetical protein
MRNDRAKSAMGFAMSEMMEKATGYPEGSVGYELVQLEQRVRALPWWQFFWKRALLHRIEATRNTIAFCRDKFIYDAIEDLHREVDA